MAHVAGRWAPYWVAARLAATARDSWPIFDGWCAARNVDPDELPPDRYLNLVYYWLTRNADAKRRAELDAKLERPPSGENVSTIDEGTWSADAEMAAFESAARAASGAT